MLLQIIYIVILVNDMFWYIKECVKMLLRVRIEVNGY